MFYSHLLSADRNGGWVVLKASVRILTSLLISFRCVNKGIQIKGGKCSSFNLSHLRHAAEERWESCSGILSRFAFQQQWLYLLQIYRFSGLITSPGKEIPRSLTTLMAEEQSMEITAMARPPGPSQWYSCDSSGSILPPKGELLPVKQLSLLVPGS